MGLAIVTGGRAHLRPRDGPDTIPRVGNCVGFVHHDQPPGLGHPMPVARAVGAESIRGGWAVYPTQDTPAEGCCVGPTYKLTDPEASLLPDPYVQGGERPDGDAQIESFREALDGGGRPCGCG